jgi:hypothetical protein
MSLANLVPEHSGSLRPTNQRANREEAPSFRR